MSSEPITTKFFYTVTSGLAGVLITACFYMVHFSTTHTMRVLEERHEKVMLKFDEDDARFGRMESRNQHQNLRILILESKDGPASEAVLKAIMGRESPPAE